MERNGIGVRMDLGGRRDSHCIIIIIIISYNRNDTDRCTQLRKGQELGEKDTRTKA